MQKTNTEKRANRTRLVVEDLEKGKRIVSSSIVCMKCAGEKNGK